MASLQKAGTNRYFGESSNQATETMKNQTIIERFVKQASQLVNNSELRDDIEGKLRILATSSFSKLDLVTREEFEAQTAVLERTRNKLDELERQLEALAAEDS